MEVFDYDKKMFYFTTILLFLSLILTLFVMLVIVPVDITWISIITILFISILLVFGISPLLTKHQIAEDKIILKQGLYFKAVVPLGNIRDVKSTDINAKIGIKFSLTKPILYVTTSKINLISIKLKKRKRFGYAWWKRADEIIFNVDDPKGFIKLVEEKMEECKK
jgi:hypothetical protein